MRTLLHKTAYLIILLVAIIGQTSFSQFEDDFEFDQKFQRIRNVMEYNNEQVVIATSHKKLDAALHGFLQTEFMEKYRNLKIDAESLAATFKASADQYPPKDVAKVQNAYTRISQAFNTQLLEIKRDFMDRKKIKVIRKDKEMYSNSLQYKLRELQDLYSQDFERVVAEVTGSEMYSISFAAIIGLIELTKKFTEFLISADYQARTIKEDHLQQYFIEPHRFRGWDEIQIMDGNVYDNYMNEDNYNEYEEENWEEESPFEETPDTSSMRINNQYK